MELEHDIDTSVPHAMSLTRNAVIHRYRCRQRGSR